MRHSFPLQLPAVLAFGTVSQIGQVLVLRELLMVFHGNELAIGLILASWLIWGAAGCRLGTKLLNFSRRPLRLLVFNTITVAAILPATIIISRLLRGFFDLLPGTHLSLPQIIIASLLAPLPLSLALGAQFVFLARIWREHEKTDNTSGAGKTYAWEAAGNLLGGLIFTFLMVHHLNSLQSAALAGSLILATALLCAFTPAGNRTKHKFTLTIYLLFILTAVGLFSFRLWRQADTWAYERQWQNFAPEYQLRDTRRSKYGNITVAERGGQYSLFQSGHLVFSTAGAGMTESSTPGLEDQEAAVFAHLALGQHRKPRYVLLIGGGLRGTLSEMLKHPVVELDYIELDPELTAAALPWLPDKTRRALEDPRVNMRYTDGRMFIKNTDRKYDMVIVDAPDPATAVLNRYYTLEFFAEAKNVLKPDGVFLVGAGSAPDLRGLALVNRKATLYHTLSQVFTRVLPIGERFVYYFASNDPEQISAEAEILSDRYLERNIESESFSHRHYHMLMRKEQMRRLGWILRNHGRQADSHLTTPESPPLRVASIAEQEATEMDLLPVQKNYFINSDFKPIGYYYTLMYWEDAAGDGRTRVLRRLLSLRAGWLIIPFPLFLLSAAGLRVLNKKKELPEDIAFAVLFAVFATGLSTMTLQIALIFSFQSVYGFIYEMIGLIVAVFMGGLGLGAALTQRYYAKQANLKTLALVQLAMTVLAALIAMLLPLVAAVEGPGLIFTVFTALTLTAGFLNGVDFPLATACCLATTKKIDKSTGLVYSTELVGACVGATLASVLLVPIFGITAACWFAALGNGTSFFVILICRRTGKASI